MRSAAQAFRRARRDNPAVELPALCAEAFDPYASRAAMAAARRTAGRLPLRDEGAGAPESIARSFESVAGRRFSDCGLRGLGFGLGLGL
jgi:hypothetical protein